MVELCEGRSGLLFRDQEDSSAGAAADTSMKGLLTAVQQAMASKDHSFLQALLQSLYARVEGECAAV